MTIKQLSIFLENKTGRINDVTSILGKNGINMQAFSMAEAADFGILRLIVSEVDRALELLKENNFAVKVTDVVCIRCSNTAGSLASVLEKLAEKEIFIEYMYAFADGDYANTIIKPNNLEKCVAVLEECNCYMRTEF
ncbi:MAG: amino acid-binding protein [Bacteroidales bacterium]|nr:amino acid-binding protein [Bacteroidales bacterium]